MDFLQHHPLAPCTTFKIGGPARWYCRPTSREDLAEAFAFAREEGLPLFCMGGGSNLLVHDNGFPGLVIHLTGLDRIARTGATLISGAGATVAAVVAFAVKEALSGLEFAGGLPGSLGGAVFMNARAYGSSFSDIVASVGIMTPDGNTETLPVAALEYGYKKSRLMDRGETVFEVTLSLTPDNPEKIKKETEANREKRVSMGQFSYPNAGCVFKNDYSVGIPSGKLIDECGLLGTRIGGAEVLPQHGNFIVNRGGATAEDIRDLIETVRDRVFEEKGIRLEEEIRYLGFPETDPRA